MDSEYESYPAADERPESGGPPEMTGDSTANRALSRFLVGLLLLGGDELSQSLRDAQQDRESDSADSLAGDETSRGLVRYLTLGLLARGERRVSQGLRTAYYASVGTASWTFQKLDRWTDNRLMRPLRQPIEARVQRLGEGAVTLIEEGKHEEKESRALAAESVSAITEDLFDYLAESPELDRFVKELVGQQGMSFASIVMDNVRSLTASADYLIEGVLRRLLRRTPRWSLPPSPVEGQPQTMYRPENRVEGEADHGR
jgi:hypothetical protein